MKKKSTGVLLFLFNVIWQ